MSLVLACYRFLLRLYPPAFRARFAEEMQAVFVQALEEAAARGWRALAGLLATEAFDQPLSLARQHWRAMSGWEGQMSGAVGANLAGGGTLAMRGDPRSSWSEAALAGLPHLMVGLVTGLPLLLGAAGWIDLTTPPGSTLWTVFGVLFLLAVLGSFVLVIARRRAERLPLWAASWRPYWVMGAYAAVLLLQQWVTGDVGWFPLMDFLVYVIVPLLFAFGLYYAARADRLRGLLSALPCMVLPWLITNEFVPDGPEGLVTLGSWLLAGLAAMVIVRSQRLGAGLAIALGVVVLGGFAHARNGIYLGGMLPFSEPGPSLKAVIDAYVPILAVTCAMGLGPQLARSLRELGLRGALQGGIWAYRLSLAGILIAMLGMLLRINSVINGTGLWGPYPALRPLIDWVMRLGLYPDVTWLVVVGGVIYAAGFVFTVRAAGKAGGLPGWPVVGLLFLALPGVPLTLYFAGVFVGTYDLTTLPRVLQHIIELAWIVLALVSVVAWTRRMKDWAALPR